MKFIIWLIRVLQFLYRLPIIVLSSRSHSSILQLFIYIYLQYIWVGIISLIHHWQNLLIVYRIQSYLTYTRNSTLYVDISLSSLILSYLVTRDIFFNVASNVHDLPSTPTDRRHTSHNRSFRHKLHPLWVSWYKTIKTPLSTQCRHLNSHKINTDLGSLHSHYLLTLCCSFYGCLGSTLRTSRSAHSKI